MPKKLELSARLISQIKDGKAILFLGAGASYGCQSADGKQKALMGKDLGIAIADKFLGGKRSNEALSKIADYASSDASQLDLQLFIKSIYETIDPRPFHAIIPRFRWRAIVTTNYDRIVEKAYEKDRDRLQDPIVLIQDGDLRQLADATNAVPIFKIHGCVSRATDTNIPFVIATEQYVKHKRGRDQLVTEFRQMAKNHPIIFCGYELSDSNIVPIMFPLEDKDDRPSYAAINPRFDEQDERYWARHKMEAINQTFEDFLQALDATVPANQRRLGQLITGSAGAISRWLKVGATLSTGLQVVINGRLRHIEPDMLMENPIPDKFYRGDSDSWAPIKHNFDFPRNLTYQLVADATAGGTAPRFILVKGHAGSGKSVLLKRLVWQLVDPAVNSLCFYCDGSLKGVKDVLQELHDASGERIFIIIDNALVDLTSLNDCYTFAQRNNLPVTFIAAARINEWNVAQITAKIIPSGEYTVGDLSRAEAEFLCDLLEKHGCLGELKHVPEAERPNRLMGQHERQLLVALHEATMGAELRQILRDEYRNITPPEAQILYLDICSLHRLGVTVRAGLVSRMSGSSFHQFQERFFLPLEKVVSTYEDWESKDFAYRTRHSEIAQIVFEEALPTQADKANQLAKIASALNTGFSSDDKVATKLLKGRMIADEFADRSLAERIFDSAEQTGVDRSFILQQRANFELKHPGGSAIRALRLIDEAIAVGRDVKSKRPSGALHHTKAVVLRDLSRESGIDSGLADRYRENALIEIKDHGILKTSPHGLVVYCEVLLDQVKARLDDNLIPSTSKLSDEATTRKLGELERNLSEGLQRWPNDSYLVGLRAALYEALSKHPQALRMLRGAFERAPANEYVALRLSRQLIDNNKPEDTEEATRILRHSVQLNGGSKSLNYQLARLLMREDEEKNSVEISKCLRRSYTDGDTHFEAQFWAARHEFLHGDRAKSLAMYARFNEVPVPYVDAGERRGEVRAKDGSIVWYEGPVRTLKGDFGFVESPQLGARLFLHRTEFGGSWSQLHIGDRVRFKTGFSFRGPCCVDTRLA